MLCFPTGADAALVTCAGAEARGASASQPEASSSPAPAPLASPALGRGRGCRARRIVCGVFTLDGALADGQRRTSRVVRRRGAHGRPCVCRLRRGRHLGEGCRRGRGRLRRSRELSLRPRRGEGKHRQVRKLVPERRKQVRMFGLRLLLESDRLVSGGGIADRCLRKDLNSDADRRCVGRAVDRLQGQRDGCGRDDVVLDARPDLQKRSRGTKRLMGEGVIVRGGGGAWGGYRWQALQGPMSTQQLPNKLNSNTFPLKTQRIFIQIGVRG